jgi:hypothetical protein
LRDEIRANRELVGKSGIYVFRDGSSYCVDDRAFITV